MRVLILALALMPLLARAHAQTAESVLYACHDGSRNRGVISFDGESLFGLAEDSGPVSVTGTRDGLAILAMHQVLFCEPLATPETMVDGNEEAEVSLIGSNSKIYYYGLGGSDDYNALRRHRNPIVGNCYGCLPRSSRIRCQRRQGSIRWRNSKNWLCN